jgi:hypothetical protein
MNKEVDKYGPLFGIYLDTLNNDPKQIKINDFITL